MMMMISIYQLRFDYGHDPQIMVNAPVLVSSHPVGLFNTSAFSLTT